MIYSFESRATGTLQMNTAMAEMALQAIGHEISPKGVITVIQMPEAIRALESLGAESGSDSGTLDQATRHAIDEHIQPLIAMLEQAHAGKKPVTWGT